MKIANTAVFVVRYYGGVHIGLKHFDISSLVEKAATALREVLGAQVEPEEVEEENQNVKDNINIENNDQETYLDPQHASASWDSLVDDQEITRTKTCPFKTEEREQEQ